MTKSQKQLLSVLFHLAVLGSMLLAYDAGKGFAEKLGWIKSGNKMPDSTLVDLMAKEETLSTEIDPALGKLVTMQGDAFVFRRDLAFPPHLKVVTTKVTKFKKVRAAGKSEFGEGSMELSVRDDEVMEYEMAARAVRFTMKEKVSEKIPNASERLARLKVIEEALKNKRQPPETRERIVDPFVGKIVQFNYDGKDWKALQTREFKTMAWGRGLEEEVGSYLVENGLQSRPRWFGTNPMKLGEVTNLSGQSLDLVFDRIKVGTVAMVLKGMEGVHGHPCAVFEVSGALVQSEKENEQGQTTSGEITIDKGRIWCSLLFPIVLRSDLDQIVSFKTKEGSKVVSQMQGPVNEKIHREWSAVTTQPKKETPTKPPGAK